MFGIQAPRGVTALRLLNVLEGEKKNVLRYE